MYEKHQAADLSFLRETEKKSKTFCQIPGSGFLKQLRAAWPRSQSNAVFAVQSPASPKTNDDGWSLRMKTYALCPSPESLPSLGAFLGCTVPWLVSQSRSDLLRIYLKIQPLCMPPTYRAKGQEDTMVNGVVPELRHLLSSGGTVD